MTIEPDSAEQLLSADTLQRRQITVLVVDDELDLAKLAEVFLEKHKPNFNVIAVESPEGAFEAVQSSDTCVDCIVSDYNMPSMNGLEFLEAVRKHDSDIPFILFTGRGSEEIASKAIRKGVTDYMQKENNTEQYQVLAKRVENAVDKQRVQESAEHARDKASQILNSSPLPTIAVTGNTIKFVNSAMREFIEVDSSKELIGRELSELFVDSTESQLLLDEVYDEGMADAEMVWINTCGSERLAEISAQKLIAENPPGAVFTFRDLSEQHAREKELENIATNLSSIASNLQGTVIAITDETSNEMHYISPSSKRLIEPDQLSDDLLKDAPHFRDTIRDGGTLNTLVSELDSDLENDTVKDEYRDSTLIKVGEKERHYDISVLPTKNGLGHVIGWVWLAIDTTTQAEQHRKVKKDREMLRKMYDCTAGDRPLDDKLNDMLELGRTYLDMDFGFITDISDGVQTIELSSPENSTFVVGSKCPLDRAYCRKTIEDAGVTKVEGITKTGWEDDPAYREWGVETYIGARIMIDGEIYGTLCFASKRDRGSFSTMEQTIVELMAKWAEYELSNEQYTTEIKQQRDRLEDLNEIISHDVKSLVTTASGYMEAAETHSEEEAFNKVRTAHKRIESIIDDVQILSSANRETLEKEEVDIAKIAEDVWSITNENKNATLSIEEPILMEASESLVSQLLQNLFNNTIEHAGKDSSVYLGRTPNGFFVADSGPSNVDEEALSQLFERGHTTGGGSGYGLYIVKQIAESHGWGVSVSKTPTGGLRFEFRE